MNGLREIELNHNWAKEEWEDWPILRAPNYNGVLQVLNTPYKWEVGLDAAAFKPEEVQVRVRGHHLMVDCKHETRAEELGSVSREIRRTCSVPDDVDTSTICGTLHPNGLLTVKGVKKLI
uniref:SHSP domain-containing protein n=1 Tax=Acrobeloides nanus TaxID=290746 RepID=A0A914CBL0_9BILA